MSPGPNTLDQVLYIIIKFYVFLLSFEGNVMKAMSILHKAQALNARPAEHLETALRNLKAGVKRLVPTREEEDLTGTA